MITMLLTSFLFRTDKLVPHKCFICLAYFFIYKLLCDFSMISLDYFWSTKVVVDHFFFFEQSAIPPPPDCRHVSWQLKKKTAFIVPYLFCVFLTSPVTFFNLFSSPMLHKCFTNASFFHQCFLRQFYESKLVLSVGNIYHFHVMKTMSPAQNWKSRGW